MGDTSDSGTAPKKKNERDDYIEIDVISISLIDGGGNHVLVASEYDVFLGYKFVSDALVVRAEDADCKAIETYSLPRIDKYRIVTLKEDKKDESN